MKNRKFRLTGAMALAMLLIVGLIAPATALVESGNEPNACQYIEYEYKLTARTVETDWFIEDPGGDWVATGATQIVDIPGCDLYELDPSNPRAGQCDPGEGAIKLDTGDSYSGTIMVDGVEVLTTVDGTNVTFSEPVEFCVKASNGNSGFQSGSTYDVDFVNRGGNYPYISNLVIYGLVPVVPTSDSVTINKVWTGYLGTDPDQTVTFSYVLTDGYDVDTPGTVAEGGTVVLPSSGSITWTGESLDPGLPLECDYTASYSLGEAATDGYTDSGEGLAQVFNVTNDVICGDDDDTVDITLAKEWFDVHGNPITEPEGIGDGSLTLMGFEMDGEDGVDVPLGMSADFEAGQRYGVQEVSPDGYAAVPCGGLTTTDAVAYNTSSVSVGLGAPDGTFAATASGVHLVCNQELPVVGRLPDTVTVLKQWTGDFDGEGVVATFSYRLDSPAGSLDFTEEGTFTEGDAPIQLENAQSIRFTGETLSVALPEGCTYEETYELVGAVGDVRQYMDAVGFTAQTFIVTNAVSCIGTDVLPVIIEAEPTPAPVVVEREVVEVLGVTATRAVPTGIDTGTGGYLPSSTPPAALLMLLMFGGLVLTGGAAASLVRRRG